MLSREFKGWNWELLKYGHLKYNEENRFVNYNSTHYAPEYQHLLMVFKAQLILFYFMPF